MTSESEKHNSWQHFLSQVETRSHHPITLGREAFLLGKQIFQEGFDSDSIPTIITGNLHLDNLKHLPKSELYLHLAAMTTTQTPAPDVPENFHNQLHQIQIQALILLGYLFSNHKLALPNFDLLENQDFTELFQLYNQSRLHHPSRR